MGALPGQTAAAFYLDYNRYFDLLLQMNQNLSGTLDSLAPNLEAKQAEEFAQLRTMTKALGGVGATMSYEPTGIRFDTAMQFDPAQLPADQRQLYEAALTPASGRAFASIPA